MNMTKQVIRHLHHKHSRLIQQLIVEDKLKLSGTGSDNRTTTEDISQTLETSSNNCFSTNQVLFIIAITCFLNFAFIVLIMMCVQILGSTSSEPENSDEDTLIKDQPDDILAETGHLTNSESSKLRLASFPDNIITKKVADRLLRTKKLKSKCMKCVWMHRNHSQQPSVAKTYHFSGGYSFQSDESETENDFLRYDDEFRYKWRNEFDKNRPNCPILDSKSNKNLLLDRHYA